MVKGRTRVALFFGKPATYNLVEYEARVTHVLSEYNAPVICNYNPSKFGAHVALDIVRAHPLVIIGGLLQENPFFLPPNTSSMWCVNDDQLAKRRHGEVLK